MLLDDFFVVVVSGGNHGHVLRKGVLLTYLEGKFRLSFMCRRDTTLLLPLERNLMV